MENGRGLVPLSSLSSLLPRFLGGPVTLHEESGRLFIGSVATHFTASLSADNPPRLVFHFTAPVNPTVATEPGALRMTFSREPLVAPASPTLTFGSKTFPSASYSESNGRAVVTVNAAIPVIASFGATDVRLRSHPHPLLQPRPRKIQPHPLRERPRMPDSLPLRPPPPIRRPRPSRWRAAILPSSTPATAGTITERRSATPCWRRM